MNNRPGQTAKKIKSVEELNWPWPLNIMTFQGGGIVYCQQSLSLACTVLVYSRKTLHEQSEIFVEHALRVGRIIVSNPGLIAVRLEQWARLWPSVCQLTDACTRINPFDERKQDWLVSKFGLRWLQMTRFTHSLLISSYLRRQNDVLFAGYPVL